MRRTRRLLALAGVAFVGLASWQWFASEPLEPREIAEVLGALEIPEEGAYHVVKDVGHWRYELEWKVWTILPQARTQYAPTMRMWPRSIAAHVRFMLYDDDDVQWTPPILVR